MSDNTSNIEAQIDAVISCTHRHVLELGYEDTDLEDAIASLREIPALREWAEKAEFEVTISNENQKQMLDAYRIEYKKRCDELEELESDLCTREIELGELNFALAACRAERDAAVARAEKAEEERDAYWFLNQPLQDALADTRESITELEAELAICQQSRKAERDVLLGEFNELNAQIAQLIAERDNLLAYVEANAQAQAVEN